MHKLKCIVDEMTHVASHIFQTGCGHVESSDYIFIGVWDGEFGMISKYHKSHVTTNPSHALVWRAHCIDGMLHGDASIYDQYGILALLRIVAGMLDGEQFLYHSNGLVYKCIQFRAGRRQIEVELTEDGQIVAKRQRGIILY